MTSTTGSLIPVNNLLMESVALAKNEDHIVGDEYIKEWIFELNGTRRGPYSVIELYDIIDGGTKPDNGEIYNIITKRLGDYSKIMKLKGRFCPDIQQFLESRKNNPLTIISGSNNSGKSFALKSIYSLLDNKSFFYNATDFIP